MHLGENIRRARMERGMTQSALAEALGISDRAVSRWERGTSAPDVALLAQLALVLDISADALLGLDPLRIEGEILQAAAESTALLRQDKPDEAVHLMREMNARCPNQPEVLAYLARALLALNTEDSVREALALGRAAEQSGKAMRLSTTFGCKQVMALALHRLGKPEQAAQLVEDEMPAIFVSRELLLPQVAPPERAARIRRSNVNLLADLLTSTMKRLGQEEPAFTEAAAAIQRIIDGLM